MLSLIGLGVFDYIINRDFTVLSMITVFIFLINMFLSDTRWYEKQINPCPVCGEGVVTIQERLSEEVAYRCDNCDFKHIIIPGRLKKYEKKDTLSNYIPCQECKNGWMKKHLDKEDNVFFECRNCGNVKEIN